MNQPEHRPEEEQRAVRNGNDCAYPTVAGDAGLTKRELFAAMAMQGIMMSTFRNDDPYLVASRAVNVADILLKELAK